MNLLGSTKNLSQGTGPGWKGLTAAGRVKKEPVDSDVAGGRSSGGDWGGLLLSLLVACLSPSFPLFLEPLWTREPAQINIILGCHCLHLARLQAVSFFS